MAELPLGDIEPKITTGYDPTTGPVSGYSGLLSNILGILTIISGLTFAYYLIIGAVNWITAGGETQKAAAARSSILNALVGLAITVIAYPALFVLSKILGLPLAEPVELFRQLQF